MRSAWRLATNNLSARRSRFALLIAAVAMSAALIVAVACALSSVQNAIMERVAATVGAADVRVTHVGGATFDPGVLAAVRAWPGVELAVGRGQGPAMLTGATSMLSTGVLAYGVDPAAEYRLRPQTLVGQAGTLVAADGEVVLDTLTAEKLRAGVGDTVAAQGQGDPVTLRVVGVVTRPALGAIAWPECYMTAPTLARILSVPEQLREIDIVLRDGLEPYEAAAGFRARGDLPGNLLVQVTERITSGLERNMRSSRIGMLIATVMSFLCASFIIMTGLTTSVTERQRELAVLRCIGATRSQLATTQLCIGGVVGLAGAIVGVPIGVGGAALLISLFPDQLPGGFAMSWFGALLGVSGSVGAGLLGAAWPAIQASRTSPLAALASRASPATLRGLLTCLVIGLAGAATHVAVLTLPGDPDAIFWGDMTFGMPVMFAGYFLLSAPFMAATGRLFAAPVSAFLRLPRALLSGSVGATPYRHGFTAGAMMAGLALHVSTWSNGRAVTGDWLESLDFPDAYVNGFNLTEETQRRLAALPCVRSTCAITLQNLQTDAFGVTALAEYQTTFIAFEPEPFFAMTRVKWIQGDPETAIRRLSAGGAIIVAREFLITRGLGVGDRLVLKHQGAPHEFEIVGVVTSPGLDLVSKYFDIGAEYAQMAVNAVMGSRDDLKRLFGNDAVNLVQIALRPGTTDQDAVQQIRKAVGFGVISAGSGRQLKEEIRTFLEGTVRVFSTVAVAAMLVACLGVANLMIAGVHARQFEFGVLRAVGAERALLGRLVLGEAVLIAICACFLGTVMGMQGAWAGARMYEVLFGLLLPTRLPVDAAILGWGMLSVITLLAAAPAAWSLARKQPRELLGAVRG